MKPTSKAEMQDRKADNTDMLRGSFDRNTQWKAGPSAAVGMTGVWCVGMEKVQG